MKTKFVWLPLIFLILGIAIGSGITWYLLKSKQDSETNTSVDSGTDETPEAESPREYSLDKEVSVYLVWWDQDNGFKNLKKYKNLISTVHPFWYQINSDGSISKFSGAEDEEIIEFCKTNNIQIIPVISNEQNPEPVRSIINDKTATDSHISDIMQLVNDNGYDGIEIDYENLEADDRTNYSTFLTDLSNEIHQNSKLLTTAVHAKTADEGSWGGPAAQDWTVINNTCDRVKVMTYDYHWSTSEAGDIAPISWMEEVLDYALTVLNQDKIQLGIHFYGYDWQGKNGKDLTYTDVLDIQESNDIGQIMTTTEEEKYFIYDDEGEKHTVYFADNEVVRPRIELANKYDIAGIGIWRIGQEDELNWTQIEDIFNRPV